MLITILELFYHIFHGYWYVMIASIILSFISSSSNVKVLAFIREVGEWYIRPFTGKVYIGIFDIARIIGFILYTVMLDLLRLALTMLYI